jgi:hypothetical protein
VGLVAELVGHADPTITLGYYTQAVRRGAQAVDRIELMYRGETDAPPIPASGMAPAIASTRSSSTTRASRTTEPLDCPQAEQTTPSAAP